MYFFHQVPFRSLGWLCSMPGKLYMLSVLTLAAIVGDVPKKSILQNIPSSEEQKKRKKTPR